MADGEIRAVVADEVPVMRLGIVATLEPLGIDVVAQASSGREAAQLAALQLPELVVLGSLLDQSVADTVRRLRLVRPVPAVVGLVPLGRPDDLAAFGAVPGTAVLPRAADPVDLADAALRALKGEVVVAPSCTATLAATSGGPGQWGTAAGAVRSGPGPALPVTRGAVAPEPLGSPLTARECEVLVFLADGCSNREIAAALSVGLATVKSHLVHLYAKLGARNRNEALGRAIALGILGRS